VTRGISFSGSTGRIGIWRIASSRPRGLAEFREHPGGRLTVILLTGIGSRVDAHDIRIDVMSQAIRVLREREAVRARSTVAVSARQAIVQS
jgi:hypothetical protein